MSKFKKIQENIDIKLSDNIKILKELEKRLIDFPTCVTEDQHISEYKMEKGTSLAWNLFSNKDISVGRWFNSKDSVFPKHTHNEKEWLIVYKGTMKLFINGKQKILKTGDYAYIDSEVLHSSSYPEDCWFIAIIIPGSKDWPKK